MKRKKYNVTVKALKDCTPKLELAVTKNGFNVFKKHQRLKVDWKPTIDFSEHDCFGLDYDGENFRYWNIGCKDGLIDKAENYQYSAFTTCAGFIHTERKKCFDIPPTKELWVKFETTKFNNSRFRAYNENANGVCGICSYDDFSAKAGIWVNDKNITDVDGFFFSSNKNVITVLLHMKSDTDNGIVEAWVDGTLVHSYTGDVNHGEDFADFYLQGDESQYTPWVFSNIIISNREISMDENVDLTKVPAFRYENIGIFGSIIQKGIGTTDRSVSKTGYAYKTTEVAERNIPIPCSRDLWAKFDFYSEKNKTWLTATDYGTYTGNLGGIGIYSGEIKAITVKSNISVEKADYSGHHTVIMHMTCGETNGVLECWMDGEKKYYDNELNISNGIGVAKFSIKSDTDWISNVIVSNRELTFDDNCRIYEPFIQPQITSAEELGVMGESDFAIESNIEKIVDILNGKTVYSLNNNHYIKFFTKRPIVLRRINLRTRILGVALQYSDDGKNWTDCGVGYNNNGIPYVDCTEDKPHQYFRMNIIKKNPVYSASDMWLFHIDAEYAQF